MEKRRTGDGERQHEDEVLVQVLEVAQRRVHCPAREASKYKFQRTTVRQVKCIKPQYT